MIIDFDSHLREGYFMDEVYKLEGSYERFWEDFRSGRPAFADKDDAGADCERPIWSRRDSDAGRHRRLDAVKRSGGAGGASLQVK